MEHPTTFEEYQQQYARQVREREERDAEDVRRLRAEAAEFIDQTMRAEAAANDQRRQTCTRLQAEMYDELSVNDKIPQWKRICEMADVSNPPEGVDTARMADVMRRMIGGVQQTLKSVPALTPMRAMAGEPEPAPRTSPIAATASNPWGDVLSQTGSKQEERWDASPVAAAEPAVTTGSAPLDNIFGDPVAPPIGQSTSQQSAKPSLMDDLFGDVSPPPATVPSSAQDPWSQPAEAGATADQSAAEQERQPDEQPVHETEDDQSARAAWQEQDAGEADTPRGADGPQGVQDPQDTDDSSFSGEVVDTSSEDDGAPVADDAAI